MSCSHRHVLLPVSFCIFRVTMEGLVPVPGINPRQRCFHVRCKNMFCRGKTRVRFLAEQQHHMHTIYWHVVDFIRRRHVCDQWNPEYFILYPTEHPPTYTQPCTTWKVHCELCGDETETTWHFWHFCIIPEERTPNPAFENLENF